MTFDLIHLDIFFFASLHMSSYIAYSMSSCFIVLLLYQALLSFNFVRIFKEFPIIQNECFLYVLTLMQNGKTGIIVGKVNRVPGIDISARVV